MRVLVLILLVVFSHQHFAAGSRLGSKKADSPSKHQDDVPAPSPWIRELPIIADNEKCNEECLHLGIVPGRKMSGFLFGIDKCIDHCVWWPELIRDQLGWVCGYGCKGK